MQILSPKNNQVVIKIFFNLLMQLGRREGEAELVGGFQLLLPVDAPVHPAELDVGHQHEVLRRTLLAFRRLREKKSDKKSE